MGVHSSEEIRLGIISNSRCPAACAYSLKKALGVVKYQSNVPFIHIAYLPPLSRVCLIMAFEVLFGSIS